MRVLFNCKKLLLTKWSINVAIFFALFTLFFLTRNFVQVVHRTRSAYHNDLAEELGTRPYKGENSRGVLDRGKNENGDQKTPRTSTLRATTSSHTNSAPFVVILAQWRFGSTVIGELFNQNPDIFFLFEPLWLMDALRREKQLPSSPFSQEVHEYSTRFMRDIAACNLTKEYVRLTNTWGGLKNNRAVCEATSKRPGCKFPNADMINNLCSKLSGLKATKVIRADLENIKPLVIEDKVNVKVIHLVRDPRGAAASRIHYYFEYWKDIVEAHKADFPKLGRLAPMGLTNATARLKDCIPTMCKWMRETIQDASDMPDWLKGRYHLLRYEDFAEAPLNTTEELYRFVGLPLPERVRAWVHQNTEAKHSAPGTFAVRKNSRETAQKWLSDLSDLEIQQVENECLDVMADLGYERYADLKSSRYRGDDGK